MTATPIYDALVVERGDPLPAVDPDETTMLPRIDPGPVAATAGEQDHTHPWEWSGAVAGPP